MSAIIKVHISACPECGTNEWLMEVPDEIARKPGVQRGEQTPSQAFRRGMWIGVALSRWAPWFALMRRPFWSRDDPPTSDTSVTCANCGHEMNFTQAEDGPRSMSNGPLT